MIRFIGKEYYSSTYYVDENGSVIDEGDRDWYDSEVVEWKELRCADCGSNEVEDVDKATWEAWFGPHGTPPTPLPKEEPLTDEPPVPEVLLVDEPNLDDVLKMRPRRRR